MRENITSPRCPIRVKAQKKNMIEYTITRSNRKTIGIYVRNASVEVRANYRTPESHIIDFVSKKEKWITKHLTAEREKAKKRANFMLTYGDTIRYRGELYPIVERPGRFAGFYGDNFYMPPNLSPEQIKSNCIEIYRDLAEFELNKRACEFVERMLVLPTAIRITNAKARWGSCSSKRSVCFSWRLMMADDGVIDYIVVHELAHIIEMNHSTRFWKIVESILPDYEEREKRLRELQNSLRYESWD